MIQEVAENKIKIWLGLFCLNQLECVTVWSERAEFLKSKFCRKYLQNSVFLLKTT